MPRSVTTVSVISIIFTPAEVKICITADINPLTVNVADASVAVDVVPTESLPAKVDVAVLEMVRADVVAEYPVAGCVHAS